jgi:hypothetical protein
MLDPGGGLYGVYNHARARTATVSANTILDKTKLGVAFNVPVRYGVNGGYGGNSMICRGLEYTKL